VWFVVGLGNPGSRYRGTRHNVGFMVVDALADRARVAFGPDDLYDWASSEIGTVPVLLAKPRTYVNRSGDAVYSLLDRRGRDSPRLLVVVDDIHLPFGRLRLRPSGSAGGHNGLRSIEVALSSSAYPRLRIGVGSPQGADRWVDHVLGGFDEAERIALPDLIARAADAVELVVVDGVAKARARINAPPGESGEPGS